MKKIFALLTALFIFTTPLSSYAEVVGHIYKTDIKAYENYIQIPSYNCGGTTVVFARDLENYGYDIIWDEESMTVEIIKNNEKSITPMIPQLDGDEEVGTVLYDIYRTDIKTFFGGKSIPAYNIGGKIAIEFRSLGSGKSVTFDAINRRAHLSTKKVSLTDTELKHIDYVYKLMGVMSVVEDDILAAEKTAFNGKYSTPAIENLKSSTSALSNIIDDLRDYKEPAVFSNSTMELWWAMVNLDTAADLILSSNKVISGANKERYQRCIEDYKNQKQNTLNLMASEF